MRESLRGRVPPREPRLQVHRSVIVIAGLCCAAGLAFLLLRNLRQEHVAYDELQRGAEASASLPPGTVNESLTEAAAGPPPPIAASKDESFIKKAAGPPPPAPASKARSVEPILDNYCSYWPPTSGRPQERSPPPPESAPDCDGTPLNFSLPPFAPLPDCPNVFLFMVSGAGNGHRLSSFAIALSAAFGSHAAVVIDRAIGITSNGDPGLVTEAFAGLFSIRHFKRLEEATAAAWAESGNTSWGQLALGDSSGGVDQIRLRAAEGCGRLFKLGGCSDGYCMESARVGHAYRNARPILRRLYASGTHREYPLTEYSQALQECPRALAVAWHFRNGDVTLYDNEAMFHSIYASITAALGNISAQHYVFMPKVDPARGFGFLWKPDAPRLTFMSTSISPEATFVHLAAADVLVQLGSSFSYMAAMAAPSSQVRLYAPPKEVLAGHPGAYNVYWLDGAVPITLQGVDPADEARLAALVRARFEEANAAGNGCDNATRRKP